MMQTGCLVSDNDEVSSTSGYVFTLGGGAVSWRSAKQTCIDRSTMESEFITLEFVGQEVEWLKGLHHGENRRLLFPYIVTHRQQ